jgi:hypothetical protein
MTSNGNSVIPASAGTTTSSVSLAENAVTFSKDHYIPEIAIVSTALCFILVFFLVMFPKNRAS